MKVCFQGGRKFLLPLILSAVLGAGGCVPAFAQDLFAQGSKEFKAKHYAQAAQYFKKAIALRSDNPTAYYYYALSLHYAKDLKGAKQEYGRIISYFPLSDAANYARQALSRLDPAYLRQLDPNYNPAASVPVAPVQRPTSGTRASGSTGGETHNPEGGTGSGLSSRYDSAPDDCRVYFTKDSNCLVLDGTFNNRPHKIMFDTGAESTVFGKNQLSEMGIPAPTGAAVGEARGVGEGGSQKVWSARMDIRIGNIERKNFPVMIQENMPGYPLLGQSFFQDFTYTIDNGANSIHFVRRGSRQAGGSAYANSARDPYSVPFTRVGREIIVNAELNGRPLPVYFDTGASDVALTYKQANSVGVSIPEQYTPTVSTGIAGETRGKRFPVRSLKVGPIEKRDFDITVIENADMDYPLLGQSFYGDWQYTIDYQASVIRFVRR